LAKLADIPRRNIFFSEMTWSFAFDVIPRQALNLEVSFLLDVRDCLLKMFTPTTIIRERHLIGGDVP
jgi:hypothetical protein